MKSKRQMAFLLAGMVFFGLLFCMAASSFLISRCEAVFYDRAAAVASVFPKEASEVMRALKDPESMDISAGREVLMAYGYRGRLMNGEDTMRAAAVCAGFLACFAGLAALFMAVWNRRETRRIEGLIQYLREVEKGVYPVFPGTEEDQFSHLEDEIYKTVAALRESRETAVRGNRDAAMNCDIGWTAEALGNLLKNCSEYGPDGSAVTVTAEENPIFTQITVEDEGPGLTQEDLAHLFDRFYKGKQSAKGSIGIGLSLAKTIVRRQGGGLWAENRKEGGARFVMRFYKNILF